MSRLPVVENFIMLSHFVLHCILFLYGWCVLSKGDRFIASCPFFSPPSFLSPTQEMHYSPSFYCFFIFDPFSFDCLFLSLFPFVKVLLFVNLILQFLFVYIIFFGLVLLLLISYFVPFPLCQSFYAFNFILQINSIIFVFSIIINI